MSLAYSLGRALRALTGRSLPHSSAPPARGAANAPSPPSWRAARIESDGLHMAVTALESHTGMLQQIADTWLMWANLWTSNPAHFRANLGYARSIATRLDQDAEALVNEVRRLERLRDSVAIFERRRVQAEQFTDAVGVLSVALHARLHEVASAQGADAAALTAAAYGQTSLPDAAWVQRRAAAVTDAHGVSLKEVLE